MALQQDRSCTSNGGRRSGQGGTGGLIAAFLFTGAFCCFVGPAIAQTTGQLRLVVDPGHDFQVILDGAHRMQERVLDLPEGNHRLQLWAPTRRIVDTTVYVRAGSSRELVVRLPYSAEFIEYQYALGRFRKREWLSKALPSVATAGALGWATASYVAYSKAGQQLRNDKNLYNTSADPGEIAELKNDRIPAHQDDFRRSKVMLGVSTGVFAVAAAYTIWSYRRADRTPLPLFDDREKVRFDGLVWLPGPDGRGVWAAGLTIPLR
ncbi:MAG TPA: hypothetical protein PKE21_00680 [Flavobacteriales bacterium]|nr:hypothetical protein [Flavobacteriales bacterium]HMR25966.1 hypothetical protein [Flavobacteriales bacterium]